MSTLKHIHKLKKHKYPTGNAVYFCTLPECNFKGEVELQLGKQTICNICGAPFIINKYTLRLNEPHCPNCGRVEVKDEHGNKRYIRKVGSKVLTSIAQDTSKDLRARLDSVVASISGEDDI